MQKKIALLILLGLSIIPLFDLLSPGLPITHDGQDHVARIANFYQSLTEGNLIPRWAANLNWGYGHPILMFLYPIPSYLASAFHFLGLSLIDSTKLVFASTYLISMFVMFLWISAEWGIIAGLVAGILYGFAPYRFVDLYVRGAIGEHVAFVFMPLVLYGLWKIAHDKSNRSKSILITSLSITGLLLSHNAISLMFLPIVIIYSVYLYWFIAQQNKEFVINSIVGVVLGFTAAAFFWIPAFFEGKYTLRDIVTKGGVDGRFVEPIQYIFTKWNYGGGNQLSKEIGLLQLVSIILAAWLSVISKEKRVRWFMGISLMMLFISLFLMLDISLPIWNTITVLQKFQFPWRFLTITVFISAVLGGVVATFISKSILKIILVLGIVIILFNTNHMWKVQAYLFKSESFFTGIYNGTTDTGESSPIWSVRFMEHQPIAPLEFINGKGEIIIVERNTTKRVYRINVSERARLVENTLYFPGWKVLIDGIPQTIEFQDPAYRGLMTFYVDKGQHDVTIVFQETKLRQMANGISIVTSILLVVILFFSFKEKQYVNN